MGISVRQAKRYVESLEGKGFLRVVERFLPDGSQTTNEFDYSPLIRAVVDAARADGALDPSAAPAIVRRARSRATADDSFVTPPVDTAVTPGDAGVVTPGGTLSATGPRSATSPKEDGIHVHPIQTDGDDDGTREELAELVDLFVTIVERPATAEEQALLDGCVDAATPLAARAVPPTSGSEWVAAALMELAQCHGAAIDLAELPAVVERYAAVDDVSAPPPATCASRNKRPPIVTQPALTVRQPVFAAAPNELVGVWHATLDDLREQMVPANFSRWLARTRLVSQHAGEAVVGVPDQVSADQLARRFDPLVRRALTDACGEAVRVRYEVLAS
jgi:hypothetical protein